MKGRWLKTLGGWEELVTCFECDGFTEAHSGLRLAVCVCSLSQKVLKSYNKAVVSCLNTALNYYTKYILYKLRCLVCLNQTLVWICSGRSVHRNCTHIFTGTLQAAFTPHLFGVVQTNCVFADLIWSGWCESVNQTGSFVPWRGFQCHWSNL